MSNTIKTEREKKGLSQRELARISGVPKTTIRDMENGSNPRFNNLFKVVRALKSTS